MIVVVVIGIIASIAFPAFEDYKKKGRRSEAHNLLMQIAARQEQFFQDNRSYSNDFTTLGTLSGTVTAANVTSANGYYTITIARPTLYTYSLTATPVASSPQGSDSCTTLTIDQDGTKGFTPLTAKGCW
jgi:type IV pilus assembly protein PilE